MPVEPEIICPKSIVVTIAPRASGCLLTAEVALPAAKPIPTPGPTPAIKARPAAITETLLIIISIVSGENSIIKCPPFCRKENSYLKILLQRYKQWQPYQRSRPELNQ